MSRRAYSIVEVLVAGSIMVVLLVVIYQLWIGASRGFAHMESRQYGYQRAQIALTTISRELQSARLLAYPAAGDEQDGVSLIDTKGCAVVFEHNSTTKVLDRVDVTIKDRSTLIDNVTRFRCRVPAVPGGREARLVHITLTVQGPDGREIHLITSVRLRTQDPACPLDL